MRCSYMSVLVLKIFTPLLGNLKRFISPQSTTPLAHLSKVHIGFDRHKHTKFNLQTSMHNRQVLASMHKLLKNAVVTPPLQKLQFLEPLERKHYRVDFC